MKPQIEIRVTRPALINDTGAEIPAPFQDVEIVGNRHGLLHLAEIIQRVAESNQKGYHTHIYPDDRPRLLRNDAFSITISVSLK